MTARLPVESPKQLANLGGKMSKPPLRFNIVFPLPKALNTSCCTGVAHWLKGRKVVVLETSWMFLKNKAKHLQKLLHLDR